MTTAPTFVIVGASLAGARAAETLRAEGYDGRVVLIGEEPERPYERPPRSKGYLAGEAERDSVYVHDTRFYEDQGRTAALNMLGHATPYQRVPYFYSDQYDVGMEYSGHAPSWDRVVFRGDPASREFVAFWLTADRVVAGMSVNVWDVTDPIQQLIRSRSAVDVGRLTDPDVPLESLSSAGPRSATSTEEAPS